MEKDDEVAYKPGDTLAGKYRVEHVLGIGGFGAVLAATHLQLEEKVAIKVLLPQAAKNPAASERFLREARAAVRIRSEHVARVSDVGSLPDGVPYMVMEYLDGHDLSTVVKQRGGQRVEDVAEWLLQACEAIAEAHSLGIVHRDLKPANLFLTRRVDGTPCVKVLDFGISKLTNETGDKGMTKTSDVMGSPFYMSPEQMRSTRDVDARSDVWALGAILFELLAGAPPFDAETMTALVVSIMQEPPRDLSQYRRDVPPAMRDIVLRCLQKDRGQRYPDVAALATALAPFAHARAATSVSRVMAVSGRTSQPTPMPTQAGAGPTTPGMPQITGFDSLPPGTSPTVQGVASSSGPIAPAPTKIDGATMEGLPPPSVAMRPSAMSATAASQSWAGTMASTAPRASRMPLFVGVGALAIAALAGGGFVLMQSRKVEPPKTSAVVIDAKTTAGPVAAADATPTATTTEPNVAPVGTASAIAPATTAAAPKPPVGANGKPTATAAATSTPTVAPTVTAPPTPTSPPTTKPPATTAPTVTKPPAAPDPFDRPD